MSKLCLDKAKEFFTSGHEYDFKDIDLFLQDIKDCGIDANKPYVCKYDIREENVIGYYNIPVAFDTETTSYILKEKNKTVKTGFMYVWMLGINGICIMGRRWEEYLYTLKRLKEELRLNRYKRLVIYVHNLAFDMQFFRRLIHIDELFMSDIRTPIYFISDCFEYRCSYIMTGESLATVGKNLVKYKQEKLVGDLDYDLCRTWKTPLTSTEKGYCWADIRVQMAKLQELLDGGETIAKMPLTATGFVRREVRDRVLKNKKLKKFIQSLTLSLTEYNMWKECFQGGHTHGNILYEDQKQENVVSMDETSAYPTVMISEMYPMSNGVQVELQTEQEIIERSKSHILLFYITIYDFEVNSDSPDAPIARSKCIGLPQGCLDGYIFDNGKVRKGKEATMVLTNVGFDIIRQFYKFKAYKIGTCYQYQKGYLPKEIVECILDYYEAKTSLKGVVGREIDYLTGKKRLNAIFGMMVMDIIREILEYDEDYISEEGVRGWKKPRKPQEDEALAQLEQYNKSRKRFNWYPWGCMITEYARYNLLTSIYEMGVFDFIYSDTDSIKFLNEAKHKEYFENYNQWVTYKLEKACEYHGIDKERLRPKTIKGVPKPLGVWDFDGHYSEFKFLHSKCYIAYLDDDPRNDKDDIGLHCTIAGIPKQKAKAFLEKSGNPFDTFTWELVIPKTDSGKLCHHYCDDEYDFEVTDYQGNTAHVKTMSGVCLEKMPFELKDMPSYTELAEILNNGRGE